MPQICITSNVEIPIGTPFTHEGKQVGSVCDCQPFHDRYAVHIRDVPEWVVLAIHQPDLKALKFEQKDSKTNS